MMRVKTVRERVLLGILVLLVLFSSVVALAGWRWRGDQDQRASLNHRTQTLASLEEARSDYLRASNLITAAIFAEAPTAYVAPYRQAQASGDTALDQARLHLAAMGENEGLEELDSISLMLRDLRQDVDGLMASAIEADRQTRLSFGQQYHPDLWPRFEQMLAELTRVSSQQEANLAAEQANADRASDLTLALLVASSLSAFVVGSTVLVAILVSVLRPLSALRRKLLAMTSGDLDEGADVTGPEEVASLARDFNKMLDRRRSAEEALRESERRLRTVVSNAPVILFTMDENAVFTLSEGKGLEALGLRPGGLVGRSVTDIYGDSPEMMEQVEKARAGEGILIEIQGVVFEVRYTSLVDHDGNRIGGIGVATDVTDRKRAEDALRASETKYRQIFENVQDIYYCTDAKGIITEIGPSVRRWGYTREGLIGTQVLDVYADPEARKGLLEALMRDGQVTDYEVMLRAADGHAVYSSVGSHLLYDAEGSFIAIEGVLREITERKLAEQALREQMRRDPLTGVFNHAAIMNELRGLIANQSSETTCAVLMTDVDDLKAINDTFGHQVGDTVLMVVADALSWDGTVVGRYGGDEFVAILPGAGRDAAERYRMESLAKLKEADIRDPHTGSQVPVVVSIGVAIYPIEAGRIEELVELADSGMYSAKRQRMQVSNGLVRSRREEGEAAARILGEVVPYLTTTGDLNEKLRLVAQRLSLTTGYDAVSFMLFGPNANDPPSMVTYGRAPEKVLSRWNSEEFKVRRTQGTSSAKEQWHPRILGNLAQEPGFTKGQREILRKAGLQSALVAPMLWRNERIGALAVASVRENAFTPRDAQLLTAVATQVTAIVGMETLVTELQSASGKLEEAHMESVMLLAAAAEAHDRTTGQHLRNVRAISEELAKELGWSDEDARELGLAAVLHDIGKIRVADSVLANTGRLTEQEWELMKLHSPWGEEFLAGRPGFEKAGIIARSHHERWDGQGYPNGLAGDQIPEVATIVAVADSFDAMTSSRPYKPGLSIAAAMEELKACSGKQFNPSVVKAMMRLHRRKKLPAPHHPETEDQAA